MIWSLQRLAARKAGSPVAFVGEANGEEVEFGKYRLSVTPWFSVARSSLMDAARALRTTHKRRAMEMGRGRDMKGRKRNGKSTARERERDTQELSLIHI